MENARIAAMFDKIADLYELSGENEFRVRSYRNAARTVKNLSHRMEDLVEQGQGLTKFPNIGKSIEAKIKEAVHSGTIKRLEELESGFPEEITLLMQIPQLGARKAMQLHKELGIGNLEELKKACEENRVRELSGMGKKTEENILKGIQMLKSQSGRMLYHEASEYVGSLVRLLKDISEIKRMETAGSFRRRMETVGDLDVLIHASNRDKAINKLLKYKPIAEVIGKGREKTSVRLDSGLQIDFRFFDPKSFGAALLYFTGSKAHNIVLRKRAQNSGWKLNEYGLFEDHRLLAGRTEEDIYKKLSLPWIPPELREDRGEVEAAEKDKLPRILDFSEIKGDMHAHTKATDGQNTIEEMAQAARDRGYSYLAITDHTKRVSVAGGLDDEGLKRHADNIREVNEELDDLWLMAGVEVDILKSGKLDIDEDLLSTLDWVVASVHYDLKLDSRKMTDRIIAAVKSGVVHCLGHPLDRMIGSRESLAYDMDKVMDACKENNVYLEINAQPDRLDLPDTFCRQAVKQGIGLVIATDAHKPSDMDFMDYGVGVARRGWARKKDVLNTSTPKQLAKKLKK